MRLFFVSSNYLFVHVQISFKQKKKKQRNFQAFEVFTFEKYVGLWFQEIFCLPKLKKM